MTHSCRALPSTGRRALPSTGRSIHRFGRVAMPPRAIPPRAIPRHAMLWVALAAFWATAAGVEAQAAPEAAAESAAPSAATETAEAAAVEAPPAPAAPAAPTAPATPATPAAPAAPPRATPPEVPAPPSGPVEACAGQARARAADAVVRIRSGGRWGAGFLYQSPTQVVTSFSLIRRGQAATVYARNGQRIDTELLASDESYDLAVLALKEPLTGVVPLRAADLATVRVGAPVVAIGHPNAALAPLLGERGRGLFGWSARQGTVEAVNEVGVRVDVPLTPGHVGGPLLSCDGGVVGTVADTGGMGTGSLGLAARAAQVDALVAQAGTPGEYLGGFALRMGLGASLWLDEEGHGAPGLYLSLGVNIIDRISWMNRLGFNWGGIDGPAGAELANSRTQFRWESVAGYRFFVDIGDFFPLYIVPAAGIALTHDQRSARIASVVPAANPTDAPAIDTRTVETDELLVRPAGSLSFLFGNKFEVGYTFELGLDTRPVETYHIFRLGFLH